MVTVLNGHELRLEICHCGLPATKYGSAELRSSQLNHDASDSAPAPTLLESAGRVGSMDSESESEVKPGINHDHPGSVEWKSRCGRGVRGGLPAISVWWAQDENEFK